MTTAQTPEYVLRGLVDADRGFVFSAWIRGAYEVEPTCYQPRARFETHQRAHIDRCLALATTMVACHPDSPGDLFGFVCMSNIGGVAVVHWIYVRGMWRKRGIARSIIQRLAPNAHVVVATQWSKHCPWIRRRIRLFFDPYVVGEMESGPAALAG